MDEATINRYQPGGDLYLDYVNQSMTLRLTILLVLLAASVLVFALCGCANSAKQDAAASAEYIRLQNYAATNTPLPMNLNYNQLPPVPGVSMDSPRAIRTGFVRPVVSPLTNGCSQIVWKGMTNIACPQPSVTNITLNLELVAGNCLHGAVQSDAINPKRKLAGCGDY